MAEQFGAAPGSLEAPFLARMGHGLSLVPDGAREEGLEMRLKGAVEDGALRLAALIGRQGTGPGHARAGWAGGPGEDRGEGRAGGACPRRASRLG